MSLHVTPAGRPAPRSRRESASAASVRPFVRGNLSRIAIAGAVMGNVGACTTEQHLSDSAMVRTAPDASMEAAPVPSIDCIAAGGGQRRDSGFLSGIFTAHIDLASFCATFECPYRSIQDFLKMYSCSPIDPGGSASDTPRLIGCGLETVGGIGIFGGTQYAFDATTGALVGAKTASDTPFGPCNSALYLAGRLRSECASETLYDCRAIP